jgi:uncharacterized protein (DUF736 family)
METKQNEGVIFKNNKKPEGSKQPDYRGEIDCDGVKKEIALWVRKSEKGLNYFSVKLSEPWKKTASPPESDYQKIPAKIEEQETDDLPF